MSRAKQEPFNHLPPSQYSVWQREYRTSEGQHTHTPHAVWHMHTLWCHSKENGLLETIPGYNLSTWRSEQLISDIKTNFFCKWIKHKKVLTLSEQLLCTPDDCNLTHIVTWHHHYESHNWQKKKTGQLASLPTLHAFSVSYVTFIIKHARYLTKY